VKVVCHARCGNYKFIPKTTSVGTIAKQTGYHVTFSVGDIVYYCGTCYQKAQELAYSLLSIVKDKEVRLADFFPKSAPKPFFIETSAKPVDTQRRGYNIPHLTYN